jgi:hypothetical protein
MISTYLVTLFSIEYTKKFMNKKSFCFFLSLQCFTLKIHRVIILVNDCPIAVGVGDVIECAASLVT